MLKKLCCFSVIYITLFLSSVSYAQVYDVGIYGGAAGYIGDLNPKNVLKFSGGSYGLLFRYNFKDQRNIIKSSFTHAQVKANDAWSKEPVQIERNLNFQSPIGEFAISYEFNFFKFDPITYYRSNTFSPYLSMGVAVFRFNPKTLDGQPLAPKQNEGVAYKTTSVAFPIAFGLKYKLKPKLVLFGELGYRFTLTDYLDDVSGSYPNGAQRGSLQKNDTYFMAVVGLSFSFVSSRCPSFDLMK